jgi:DNA-binding CsgD family transcriptional regulator
MPTGMRNPEACMSGRANSTPKVAMRLVSYLLLICGLILGLDVGAELHSLVLFWQNYSILAVAHLLMEVLARLGVGLAFVIIRQHLRQADRVHHQDQSQLHALRQDFERHMHDRFTEWGLSAAESDVAILTMRGLKIAEIAHLRHTQTGTIKAQLSSIFRKSSVSTRTEFVARFMDEFLDRAAVKDPLA